MQRSCLLRHVVQPGMALDLPDMKELYQLADLIKQRNTISEAIATVIGRPAEIGHIGEYIAAHIFDIALHTSASQKSSDGIFQAGALTGRSVNIKWYGKREGMLESDAQRLSR